MASVAANWTQPVGAGAGTQNGPVAIARSFAREMKFRVFVTNSATPAASYYQDVVINPFTTSDYGFWTIANLPVSSPAFAQGVVESSPLSGRRFFVKKLTTGAFPTVDLPTLAAPLAYQVTAGATAASPDLITLPIQTIQTDATGSFGWLVMDAATCLAHSMRPNPAVNPILSGTR